MTLNSDEAAVAAIALGLPRGGDRKSRWSSLVVVANKGREQSTLQRFVVALLLGSK
jgi:hypothetical protein